MSDLDTMSLDDLYNHLKVYQSEVQKKSKPNFKNMDFISSAKHTSGNKEVNIASVSTTNTNVSNASANIGDINQMDEDDMEEMDIKWNMALLSMRADRFWKKTWKKISIQGIDVAGFDKSKVECFNCHKMGHFSRECRAPRIQDRGRRDNYRQGSKVEEQAPKALMEIDGTGLPEFKDDTVTDYSRPSPAIKSTSDDVQNRNPSKASPSTISPKSFIKFVKANDSTTKSKTDKVETAKKPPVKAVPRTTLMTKAIGTVAALGGCKITGKGTIKTDKLEFENVYFVKDLKYNLFSVSKICDNKNNVMFTDSECIVLGRDFKLLDDANVLLRTPRQHNMCTIDLNNIVPHKDLTCLVAKASADEGMLWHMRPGHLNFKSMNKFVRHNLVRGLHIKCFENDHTCTACLKGKHHKASCKSKLVNSMTKPLHTLHIDLFGPTSVSSISHKWYCLVVTDDFSRFTWTFFLKTKDETSDILRKFITEIKNLKDLKVKIIRCDNGGEFRNKEMNDFCSQKGIKREFSNARTPQQNGVAKRRNRTLIEAARTMLADANLPVTFWTEAVNTACYVQNRVLVNKSHNKTPYELFNGRSPAIGFLKLFRCHVKILNTLDHLGKFEAKGDEGYFIGYSMSSKTFKVQRMQQVKKDVSSLRYIALPNWVHDALLKSSSSKPQNDCSTNAPESSEKSNPTATSTNPLADQLETLSVETPIPTASSPVSTACFTDSQEPSSDTRLISKRVANQVETPSLDNILTLTNRFEDILGVTTNTDESNGQEADVSNMEITITSSPTPTLRIHKDHPKSQIIGPVDTPIQTRNKSKEVGEQRVRPIGTKWVLKNKKDERRVVIRNKARLVDQGHTQEERIDYDEVFTPVARIEAIRLFLAYTLFMGFTVYHMDVKSAFLYGTIDEEVYVMQPPGFQDPEFPAKVYKVEKAMYGLHQASRAWYVLQKEDGIFLSQDKYIGDILKKFGYLDVRSSNTPIDKENPWGKDGTGKDVDLNLYRSMIGSLMYLTASRPYIMFAVCTCARHQVTPKECHLHAVKRIFRYLKGHPKPGLWYPKESPFDLVAYSNSDYGGATQDRKSTTGGCQFLGRRLISWQCKKETIVVTSTTEAEYVAAASCCGQVLWIQNQLLDYGVFDLVPLTCVIFEHFIEIIIHSTSPSHPGCGTLPSCKGFAAVLAVLKPERLKADRARMCEEASKLESCPSEIILDDLLALDLIVRFDFE
uniref:Uncharacterized protein n=1 Tax=Tanacetum cinerariifolium TaxID=118510 RepID=A0A6L2KS94_TANCI|nr:hypothetical protein [Tanacetum cinerariifolium]